MISNQTIDDTQELIDQCNLILEKIDQDKDSSNIESLINELINKSSKLLEISNEGSYYQLLSYSYLATAEYELSNILSSNDKKDTLLESSYNNFEKVTQSALNSKINFMSYKFLPWSMDYLSNYMEGIEKDSEDYEFLMNEMSKIMTGVMISTEKFREECTNAVNELLDLKVLYEGLRGIDNKKDYEVIVKDAIKRLTEIRKVFFFYGEIEQYEQAQDFLGKYKDAKFSEEAVIPDFLEQLSTEDKTEKQYFFMDQNSKQQGPFTLEQIKKADIFTNTMIWYEGLESWKPAEEIEEFTWLAPPPIPED